MQAEDASDVVSEDSFAAEADTAFVSAPADATSDRERARLAKGQAFVDPDDPCELEPDVQWMDTAREQTENDPHTRETLLQLLELAGGGAKAFKDVDSELAELIKVRFLGPVSCQSHFTSEQESVYYKPD